MKRTMQFAIGLVLVMGLAASLMPASASCSGARAVNSTINALTTIATPGNPFTPTAVYPDTPYGGSVTYYVNGTFWSFGGGDPTFGVGNDSGFFKGYHQFTGVQSWFGGGYNDGIGLFLGGPFGHWASNGVDGCIDFDGTSGTAADASECNVVLLVDDANETGYFAALSVNPNAGNDFVYNTTTGFPSTITMAPIPKPTILASLTTGSMISVTATVNPGPLTPANGFDLKCQAAGILQGYKIYVREIPGHDTPKPHQIGTREIDQITGPPLPPWIAVTGHVPIGQPANFQLDCSGSGDTDYYLCGVLRFGGVAAGAPLYELKNCSMNATKVECGPNMATPQEPSQQRRIDRGENATPKKQTRSGR